MAAGVSRFLARPRTLGDTLIFRTSFVDNTRCFQLIQTPSLTWTKVSRVSLERAPTDASQDLPNNIQREVPIVS